MKLKAWVPSMAQVCEDLLQKMTLEEISGKYHPSKAEVLLYYSWYFRYFIVGIDGTGAFAQLPF